MRSMCHLHESDIFITALGTPRLSVHIINDLVDHKISLQNLIRTISDSQKEKKKSLPILQPVFTSKISYTRRILVFILHIQLLPE